MVARYGTPIELQALGDLANALLIASGTSATGLAVDARAIAAATAYLASVPAVEAAAASAAITAVNEMLDTSPRIPLLGDPNQWVGKTSDGAYPFRFDAATGTFYLGRIGLRAGKGTSWVSSDGGTLAYIDPASGKTFIADLLVKKINGSDPGGGPVRPIIHAWAGQSNAYGTTVQLSAELDPTYSNMYMWDWADSTVKTATVPLSAPAVALPNSYLSVASLVARRALEKEPPGTTVTIVNGAVGGSGIVYDGIYGNWSVGYAGSNPALFAPFQTGLVAAIAAVTAKFGIAPIVRLFWHQGEADSSTSQSAYATGFDLIVSTLRTTLGLPSMPVILGGLVPEWNPGINGPRAAHIDTPKRVARTGFAYGVSNGGGSRSVTDLVHYSRQGIEVLAERMYDAMRRALTNVSTAIPYPPLTVAATFGGGVLAINWVQPFTRYTAFVVEYSLDAGTTWTMITTSTVDTTASATGLSGTHALVRVSTTNEVGTSAPSAPIQATGV